MTAGDGLLSADETDSTLTQSSDASGRTIFSATFETLEPGLYTD